MAQCNIRTPDTSWQDALRTALGLLRSAVDRWLLGGPDSPGVDPVLAVLVRCLNMHYDVQNLSLARALALVEPVERELARCPGTPGPETLHAARDELRACLNRALSDWAAGDLDDPPTERVLLELVAILHDHRLVRLPPPRHVD